MSHNGAHQHPSSPPGSPSSVSHTDSSTDSPSVNGLNAKDTLTAVQLLELDLEQTKREKEALAAQYSTLLERLTTMRTTLGNKLKQDAEELDQREQLIHQLTAQNEDLNTTVETLKNELITSHEEAERAAHELDALRNRALQDSAHEALMRERELREAQNELERVRIERDEWEQAAMRHKVEYEDAQTIVDSLRRDLQVEREAREQEADQLEVEHERCTNLQSVLEDFQAAKDHELRQAVQDYESQLHQTIQSLAEFKSRALTAEAQLEEMQSHASRSQELQKEVKEKKLLIEKLRHEAVIMNEHLIEALRRLHRNSSENSVDRALVTNVLLNFLSRPREDQKRFEMLSILANMLSWTDNERERAGLQRSLGNVISSNSGGAGGTFWSSRSSVSSPTFKPSELEKSDETESFSRLWVEFLLTEAASGERGTNPPNDQTSYSPPTSPLSATKRKSSLPAAAMASSPNLTLPPPPSRKGKEKQETPS